MEISTSSWVLFIALLFANYYANPLMRNEGGGGAGAYAYANATNGTNASAVNGSSGDPRLLTMRNMYAHAPLHGHLHAQQYQHLHTYPLPHHPGQHHRVLGGGGSPSMSEDDYEIRHSAHMQYMCIGWGITLVLLGMMLWARNILKRILHAGGLSINYQQQR